MSRDLFKSWHRSLDYHRVEHDRQHAPESMELAFAEEWEKENDERPGVNFGHGILQDLMFERHGHMSQRCREEITPRDARIVATVVQWLGTNCGRGFLHAVFTRSGSRLIELEAREYEIRLERFDRHLREREAELAKQMAEAQVLVRRGADEVASKEKFLAEREKKLAKRELDQTNRERTFITLMLLAGVGVFKRTVGRRAQRRIELAGVE